MFVTNIHVCFSNTFLRLLRLHHVSEWAAGQRKYTKEAVQISTNCHNILMAQAMEIKETYQTSHEELTKALNHTKGLLSKVTASNGSLLRQVEQLKKEKEAESNELPELRTKVPALEQELISLPQLKKDSEALA